MHLLYHDQRLHNRRRQLSQEPTSWQRNNDKPCNRLTSRNQPIYFWTYTPPTLVGRGRTSPQHRIRTHDPTGLRLDKQLLRRIRNTPNNRRQLGPTLPRTRMQRPAMNDVFTTSQPPTNPPNNPPSSSGSCLTCIFTNALPAVSLLFIARLAIGTVGSSIFLVRYNAYNQRLSARAATARHTRCGDSPRYQTSRARRETSFP